MRMIGIDPGFAILGYGIIEINGSKIKTIEYGAITTPSDMPMPDRLKTIYSNLSNLITEYQPQEASIEELFFNKNTKTALMVGQARGAVILACANNNLEVFEYTPLQIKQALVGYGRAEKMQIQVMIKNILNLDTVPKPDDIADALAAAVCHANSRNYKKLCLGY